jgi:hypothetical protein
MTDEALHSEIRSVAARATELLNASGSALPFAAIRQDFTAAHVAAALLSRFRLSDLTAYGASIDDVDDVLGDSAPVAGPSARGYWTLAANVRADVLQHLAREERLFEAIRDMEARVAASQDDPLCRGLVQLGRLGSSALDVMSTDDLAVVAPVLEALQGILPHFPSREDVERRLSFLRRLEPFERLVGTHFRGREEEQRTLRAYVGALDGQPVLSAPDRKPFLIHGVGGVGKSTLLAKFILDHAHAARSDRFPFAYLDYDRAAVAVDEPASILVETVQQIAVQFPNADADAEMLQQKWRTLLARQEQTTCDVARARATITRDFVNFVARLDANPNLPLLLVLDTLEEVQYRGHVPALRRFLAHVAKHVPRVRIVLAGRARVPELAVDPQHQIQLVEFDAKAAVAFLQAMGVSDPEIARAIVEEVGGSPLTLRLAAAVFGLEGSPGAGPAQAGAPPFPFLPFVTLRKTAIQAQLFERILQHIHDPDVKSLAHPGLVLRRITAEVIQEVLAGPCGVDVPTEQRARELFEELQREVALISPGEEAGVVFHRPDLRKMMLDPLRETKPRHVLEIHLNAVKYYSRFEDDPVLRAEEIYHRLSLGQGFDLIGKRFFPEVKPYLRNALDKLPAPEMAFLAERVDYKISAEAQARAEQELWERTAVQRIDQFVRHGDYPAAIAVLGERKERSGATMLRVREAMVHAGAGDLERAEAAIRTAPEAYSLAGNQQAAFEALLVHADIARRRGDIVLALQRLARAEEIARAGDGDDLQILRVLTAQADAVPADDAMIERIHSSAARVPSHGWSRDPLLLLRLAAIAGARDLELVTRAVRLSGNLDLTPDEEGPIEDALARTASGLGNSESSFRARLLYALEDAAGPRTQVADAVGRALSSLAIRRARPSFAEVKATSGLRLSVDDIAARLKDLSLQQIEDVLERGFDRSMRALSFGRDSETVLRDVLQVAAKEGWATQFLGALRQVVYDAPRLLASLDELGIGIHLTNAGPQTIPAAELARFVAGQRTAIARLEHRICRVETSGTFAATGFLITPSFVLASVPASDAPRVARFDFGAIDGQPWNSGIVCGVKEVIPLQNVIPAVLLRLDRSVGREPVGGVRASRNAPTRHAIAFDATVVPEPRSPLFWLWYDDNDGLHLAGTDGFEVTDEGMRIQAEQRRAFAGAPCFDRELRLVAFLRGEPGSSRDGLAIPMAAVHAGLGEREQSMLELDRYGLRLSGPALHEIRDVLIQAFSLAGFDRLIYDTFTRTRETIAIGNDFSDIVFKVLLAANQEMWLAGLMRAAAAANPRVPEIRQLVERYLGS